MVSLLLFEYWVLETCDEVSIDRVPEVTEEMFPIGSVIEVATVLATAVVQNGFLCFVTK